MKNPDGKTGMLAVLNELAEVSQAALLGLWVLLDDGDDRVGNRSLVFLKITNKNDRFKLVLFSLFKLSFHVSHNTRTTHPDMQMLLLERQQMNN